MAGNGHYRWYWSRHEQMERCHGAKATREGIIADGQGAFTLDDFEDDETPGFWIVEADTSVVRPVTFSAEDLDDMDVPLSAQWVIEQVLDANEEVYGEDGYEGPSAQYDPKAEEAFDEELAAIARLAADAADQVNAAIRRFVENNQALFAPYVFGNTRNIEFIPFIVAEAGA